ncbi:hypothetical protein B0H13DRAFT_2342116 [Mycena leptocephala]|nr:hypothetical protein B0H13DRAFT_2342116 [Mycena leptocephala]
MVLLAKGFNVAKVRFMQHHFPRYLEAIERQHVSLFFGWITTLYFETFSYSSMHVQWMGDWDDEDRVCSDDELEARRALIQLVSRQIRMWYRVQDRVGVF